MSTCRRVTNALMDTVENASDLQKTVGAGLLLNTLLVLKGISFKDTAIIDLTLFLMARGLRSAFGYYFNSHTAVTAPTTAAASTASSTRATTTTRTTAATAAASTVRAPSIAPVTSSTSSTSTSTSTHSAAAAAAPAEDSAAALHLRRHEQRQAAARNSMFNEADAANAVQTYAQKTAGHKAAAREARRARRNAF